MWLLALLLLLESASAVQLPFNAEAMEGKQSIGGSRFFPKASGAMVSSKVLRGETVAGQWFICSLPEPSGTIDDCKKHCVDNPKCVAYSYNHCNNDCLGHDWVTILQDWGEFKDCWTAGILPERHFTFQHDKVYLHFGSAWLFPVPDPNGDIVRYNPDPAYRMFQSKASGCCLARNGGPFKVGATLTTAQCNEKDKGQWWSWGPIPQQIETIVRNPDTYHDPKNSSDWNGALVLTMDRNYQRGTPITLQHMDPAGSDPIIQIWIAAGAETGNEIVIMGHIYPDGVGAGIVEMPPLGCGNQILLHTVNPPPDGANVVWRVL